jgi:hypothetical protein
MAEHKNEGVNGSFHAVKLEDAKIMTAKWQAATNPEGQPFPKSFLFSKYDFSQILEENEVTHIKAYPAIEDGQVTLLVVGVKKTGDGQNDYVDLINPVPDADISGIFNFAYPCPNTCGESPLYANENEL